MSESISPAARHHVPAACRLLAAAGLLSGRGQAAQRCQELLSSGEFDPAGLFTALDSAGELVGAMLVQPLPGALGMAWPPGVVSSNAALEDALARTACHWLKSRGVKVCQAFANGADQTEMAALTRCGFRRVTSVNHLHREVLPADSASTSRLGFVSAATDPHPFTATLLRTYEGSLDCPELSGNRTPEEIVAGFQNDDAAGKWWFTAFAEDAVGVVMWEPGDTPGGLELAYLGLVPTARGKGYGNDLMRSTIAFARANGFRQIALSVDSRNEPAMDLYRRHGFTIGGAREVFLATWV